MSYLLDTNAVIALLNATHSAVAQQARKHAPGDVAISSIVVHELYYGAFKSARKERNSALIDSLRFEVLDFDKEDARQAGEIRAFLTVQGTPIGSYDALIAGQAKARDVILVTHNLREFRHVPGLRLEDWSA